MAFLKQALSEKDGTPSFSRLFSFLVGLSTTFTFLILTAYLTVRNGAFPAVGEWTTILLSLCAPYAIRKLSDLAEQVRDKIRSPK